MHVIRTPQNSANIHTFVTVIIYYILTSCLNIIDLHSDWYLFPELVILSHDDSKHCANIINVRTIPHYSRYYCKQTKTIRKTNCESKHPGAARQFLSTFYIGELTLFKKSILNYADKFFSQTKYYYR